jgi:hypothetical protein
MAEVRSGVPFATPFVVITHPCTCCSGLQQIVNLVSHRKWGACGAVIALKSPPAPHYAVSSGATA